MDAPRGSMGSIAGLVAGASAPTWAVPIVYEAFVSGVVVGNVEHEWRVGAERRSVEVTLLAV